MAGDASNPPTAPPMPPNPTTDATARWGKTSDGRLKMFADQPWCAAAAMLISVTASHKLFPALKTKMDAVTASAQISIAVLRP